MARRLGAKMGSQPLERLNADLYGPGLAKELQPSFDATQPYETL
ncbi:hypothetical protein SMG44B_10075 [Stenotrophomonas maltophilia]